MRLFEILLLILLAINLYRACFFHQRRRLPTALVWSGPIVMLLHLLLEGARWQMYPVYVLTFIQAFSYYTLERNVRIAAGSGVLRWLISIVAVILLTISFVLPIILPVPEINSAGGSYAVGTQNIHLVDLDRSDPYAPNPSAPRELMVQIWYPAVETAESENAPWMDDAEIVAPRIAEWLELPTFFLNHLQLADSGAILRAEPAVHEEPFPLLLFSHGYGGFRAQNTSQALELASRGFVVIGVEHTYGAVVTVFPDGRVAPHNPDTIPDGLTESESIEATQALGQQWAEDLRFVLDALVMPGKGEAKIDIRLNLDPTKVGAFGHSTGGGAAIEFCALYSRCDALLTMDPYMKPVSNDVLTRGLTQPALHMFSERWPGTENTERFRGFLQASADQARSISIAGTAHYDFSDLPLLTPLANTIGLKGPLPGERVIEIVNSLSVSFFEQALASDGESSIDLDLPSYPEISSFP